MCSERTLNYSKLFYSFFYYYRRKDKDNCNTILKQIP